MFERVAMRESEIVTITDRLLAATPDSMQAQIPRKWTLSRYFSHLGKKAMKFI
jgi:hypothetical protein